MIESKLPNEISAGIVIVRKVEEQYLFLFLRALDHYDFPKGHMEYKETPLETAKRETFEETLIKESQLNFKWGIDSYTTEPYKKGIKIAIYFLAETNQKNIILPINKELGRAENDEYIWLSYEDGKKLVNKRIEKVLDWANNKLKKV